MRDLCDDGDVLYLDCISLDTLVVGGNRVKDTQDLSVLFFFLQPHVNLQLYQNKKFELKNGYIPFPSV